MNIGQFFFISLEDDKVNKTFISFLNKIKPGGIVFFSRHITSPEQICELIKKIIEELDYCPFLGMDLEGGKVNRFENIFPPLPSFSDLGKTKNQKFLHKHAELCAKAMKAFGFNINFSPVVDLDFGYQNGLENRSFGRDPNFVTSMAKTYLEVFKKYRLITTLKHFPGLGRAVTDTHFSLPSINISISELEQEDLFPFKQLKNYAPFIMVNHAHYSCFDSEILPASLSSNVIQNLLKDKLNYRGVVITDDLTMKAVDGYKETPLKAFQAGADMILLCGPPQDIEKWFKKFKEAYYKQEILERKLTSSLKRINKAKSIIHSYSPSFNYSEFQSLIAEFESHYTHVMVLINQN